jgi:tetratricopeptide (TPR) repeat protein
MNHNKTERELQLKAQEYFNIGVGKSNLQDYQKAIVNFNKATETSTDYPIPYYNRAFLKMKLNDYEGAITDFNKFIELKPKDTTGYFYINVYHNRGNSKYILKDYKGAIIDYSKAIEHKPKFATAYYKRGICKINLDQKNEGNLDLSKALELGYRIIS